MQKDNSLPSLLKLTHTTPSLKFADISTAHTAPRKLTTAALYEAALTTVFLHIQQ